MINNDLESSRWLKEFVSLILVIILLSGIAYYLQEKYYHQLFNDKWYLYYDILRMLRMIAFYILPTLFFIHRYGGSWKDLGLLPSKTHPSLSLIGGILIYFVAVFVFLENAIFFSGWRDMPWHIIWIKFIVVAVMASITDFWTRGFILFEVRKRYNAEVAILSQNVVWFVIHIYEIELLTPFIGLYFSIALTLFLGIGGDIVALKSNSILGLMLGHIILNLSIILAAKDLIGISIF
ncbi:MAG: CPBP family glutamic-type intramembrane protease [Candidatus Kariarchaeaceae archaeon]|jgi:hypothetical protein